jgi:sterol desaturase/sphingolipid hydroxylase (fatty acid hydroxylase superfamily)
MKSTWPSESKDKWNIHHRIIAFLDIIPPSNDSAIPVRAKTDKIPYLPQWPQHLWVLVYAAIPLVIHQAWSTFSGYRSLGSVPACILYFSAFNYSVVREVQIIRDLGYKYGYLDGDSHERDGVPDVGVAKVAASLYKTTGSRLVMATYLCYKPGVSPAAVMSDPKWWAWLFLEIGVYQIVLDFWFYWYHRAMHDVPFLWKFHRTHHLTKHPNPLLAAYADHEQEFFDMVGVPFLTYVTLKALGFPMGFYDWWICHQFVAFTEVWGHSGLRVHLTPPNTLSWLLQTLGAEIVVEDHDLHHRKGWRKSHNYGKQTRLWDRIFGTCTDRIESVETNVDYVNQAHLPLF